MRGVVSVLALFVYAGACPFAEQDPRIHIDRFRTAGEDGPHPVRALHAVHHTEERIAAELLLQTYGPTYRVPVYAEAGDLLRIAGQLEGTEEDDKRNKMWAYLSVRKVNEGTRTRVSSFGWQAIKRNNNNHHMPIHLFGRYEIPSSGDYLVELMGRRTGASTVAIEWAERDPKELCDAFCNCDDCQANPLVLPSRQYGQIIVEQYRQYATVQTAGAEDAMFLVDTDRAPLLSEHRHIGRDRQALTATDPFELKRGDILRTQGLATSQFISDNNLFSLELLVAREGEDRDVRSSISTENTIEVLFRFSLQNDGLYEERAEQRTAHAFQRARGLDDHGDYLIRDTDLVAMQFSTDLGEAKLAATLADSVKMTTPDDPEFSTSAPVVELFSFEDDHTAGDILRIQSQFQLQMTSGKVGAACWGRLEVYENGELEYRSVPDQRFIRNSSNSGKDHDSGTFAPFALYETRQSGRHRVRLISDCAATSSATMFAKHYGRHLTVDRFTPTLIANLDDLLLVN